MTATTTRPTSAQRAWNADRVARLAAGIGAFTFLAFGLWAMIGPSSFFDQVARFDPYNQHFIQDIGAFQLGLGSVLLLAVLRRRLDALSLALLGTGCGAGAHAVSHVIGRDLGGKTSDIPTFFFIAFVLLGTGAHRARAAKADGS